MAVQAERRLETLRCELTQAEIQQRAEDAARLDARIDELEEAKRQTAAEFKQQIKEATIERKLYARQIRERATGREVLVEIAPDWPAGQMVTTRIDTGEVVRSRPLTDAERQGQLFAHGLNPDRESEG